MELVHLRLAEIGLRVAARYGFALAGGYAVQAHGILDRPSEDVDLFTAWERRDDFTAAVDAVVDAYREAGYMVEVTQRFETFARLGVTDPGVPDRSYKVELAANWRALPPVMMDIGPVLHVDDVVAGKMSALFTRAEPRVTSSTSTPPSPPADTPGSGCVSWPKRPTPGSTGASWPTCSPCWSATLTAGSPPTAPTSRTSPRCGNASGSGEWNSSPTGRSPHRHGIAGRNGRQFRVPRPCRRQHCLYLRRDPHQHGAVRPGGHAAIPAVTSRRSG